MNEELHVSMTKSDLAHLYWLGYTSGHHDTVKGSYTDVTHHDSRSYYADVVDGFISDGTIAQTDPELDRYFTRNYPDARGETINARIIDAVKTMDIALGMKDYGALKARRDPLTDVHLCGLLFSIDSETKRLPPGFKQFARAVEAAHGITDQKETK